MAEKHIGFLCPECGSDMLTRSDFVAGQRMQMAFSVLEKMGLASRHLPGDEVPEGMVAMRMHYHDGKMTTLIQEKTDD